jgi:hypothetical protein
MVAARSCSPTKWPSVGYGWDISAWDGFYLAVFWMLNTIGWTTFYWHWKHITLWTDLGLFAGLVPRLPVVQFRAADQRLQSIWLLIWATGFMFLISWRGYWQELIESINVGARANPDIRRPGSLCGGLRVHLRALCHRINTLGVVSRG